MVKIPSLKEFSKSIPEIVNKIEILNNEIIKTKTVKKYLFISDLLVFDLSNETLFM